MTGQFRTRMGVALVIGAIWLAALAVDHDPAGKSNLWTDNQGATQTPDGICYDPNP